MPSHFVKNPNFEKLLEREVSYVEGLVEATKPAEELAKTFAPVLSGSYRDGIKAQSIGPNVYLSGMDWKSGFIEYGTQHNPVFAPLRRGAQGAGLKFRADK